MNSQTNDTCKVTSRKGAKSATESDKGGDMGDDALHGKKEPQPKPWQEKLTGNSRNRTKNRFNQNKNI